MTKIHKKNSKKCLKKLKISKNDQKKSKKIQK